MHVHVQGQNGEAKFWLEPQIKPRRTSGFSQKSFLRHCA
ncbi:MAG: DUF4160 domain-containing protein [Pseudomonadota bacterium]|nr:DUF4160 domain-containing protein [Pseudomonadota bacterium]